MAELSGRTTKAEFNGPNVGRTRLQNQTPAGKVSKPDIPVLSAFHKLVGITYLLAQKFWGSETERLTATS